MRTRGSCLLLASLLLTTSCGGAVEEEIAQAAVTSALEASRNSGTGDVVLKGKAEPTAQPPACGSPEQAAALAAATPSAVLRPSSCVTKTANGPAVHAELDSCTGIFGRRVLSGGLDGKFSSCNDADIVDSGDLTANGRPVEYRAHAVIGYVEDGRDVVWTAHWSATTKRGRFVEQDAELAVHVADPSGCLGVTGTAKGHVWNDILFEKKVQNLAICPDACPTSGRLEVTVDGKWNERTMTVTFDGSEKAKVVGFRGREFDVPLVCDE